MGTRSGGRPPKAEGTKNVRPSLTWSPEVAQLAQQLKDKAAERGERSSLGTVVERAMRLLAQEEGLA